MVEETSHRHEQDLLAGVLTTRVLGREMLLNLLDELVVVVTTDGDVARAPQGRHRLRDQAAAGVVRRRA